MPATPTASTPPTAGTFLMPPQPVERPPRRGLIALGVVVAAGLLWVVIMALAFPRRDPIPHPAPGVVIALGAGALDDSTLTNTTTIRLRTAIEYARANNATIVTTRVYGNRGEVSDRAQRSMISAAGLSERWIALPNLITNTRDEALALHMFVADTQPIAVVSSPMRTRRACATFERVGYRVTCLATPRHDWTLLPYVAAYETAALVKYKLNGWW